MRKHTNQAIRHIADIDALLTQYDEGLLITKETRVKIMQEIAAIHQTLLAGVNQSFPPEQDEAKDDERNKLFMGKVYKKGDNNG